jgi:hypothetical protein
MNNKFSYISYIETQNELLNIINIMRKNLPSNSEDMTALEKLYKDYNAVISNVMCVCYVPKISMGNKSICMECNKPTEFV